VIIPPDFLRFREQNRRSPQRAIFFSPAFFGLTGAFFSFRGYGCGVVIVQ
jgi:hypothetical protein